MISFFFYVDLNNGSNIERLSIHVLVIPLFSPFEIYSSPAAVQKEYNFDPGLLVAASPEKYKKDRNECYCPASLRRRMSVAKVSWNVLFLFFGHHWCWDGMELFGCSLWFDLVLFLLYIQLISIMRVFDSNIMCHGWWYCHYTVRLLRFLLFEVFAL